MWKSSLVTKIVYIFIINHYVTVLILPALCPSGHTISSLLFLLLYGLQILLSFLPFQLKPFHSKFPANFCLDYLKQMFLPKNKNFVHINWSLMVCNYVGEKLTSIRGTFDTGDMGVSGSMARAELVSMDSS